MFTGQCQYLPFGSCSPISTCTDLQDEKSLLLHSDFFSTYYKQFKVCSLLFSPSLIKIISNCHEMWMGNCACKIQWGLNPDCGRLQVPVLCIICPPRNSYTFSFLACLLLTKILMVHVIITAWSHGFSSFSLLPGVTDLKFIQLLIEH